MSKNEADHNKTIFSGEFELRVQMVNGKGLWNELFNDTGQNAEASHGFQARKCRLQWTSYQIGKIVGCACAGNAGNVFPATDLKGNS